MSVPIDCSCDIVILRAVLNQVVYAGRTGDGFFVDLFAFSAFFVRLRQVLIRDSIQAVSDSLARGIG